MKNISPKLRAVLLAVYFYFGFVLTYFTFSEKLRQQKSLFVIVLAAAIFFDILFLRALFIISRNRAAQVGSYLKKAFSFIGRRIRKLAGKISDAVLPKNKIFISGTDEHSFMLDLKAQKSKSSRRKLPKLAKNADERARIRHEYTCYVFKKDKNIPSYLTPNEVGKRLDEDGTDGELFEKYNSARYEK